ncbi:MAG: M4 family metallopeptidase [Caulobacter sp.]|nr:M4 family metallopeptidase [Vitreoscilla sp.]
MLNRTDSSGPAQPLAKPAPATTRTKLSAEGPTAAVAPKAFAPEPDAPKATSTGAKSVATTKTSGGPAKAPLPGIATGVSARATEHAAEASSARKSGGLAIEGANAKAVSPALARIVRAEQQVVDKLNHDKSVDAATIDATLSPERRAQLIKEQDEFLGTKQSTQADIDKELLSIFKEYKSRGDAGGVGSTPRKTPGTSDPRTHSSGADAPQKSARVPNGSSTRTPAEVAAFVAKRDVWIDDDGGAWKIDSLHGSVRLERRDDPKGPLESAPIALTRRKVAPGVDASMERVGKLAVEAGAFTQAEWEARVGSSQTTSATAPAGGGATSSAPLVRDLRSVTTAAVPVTATRVPTTSSMAVTYAADGGRMLVARDVTDVEGVMTVVETRLDRAAGAATFTPRGSSRVTTVSAATEGGGVVTKVERQTSGTLLTDGTQPAFTSVTEWAADGSDVRRVDSVRGSSSITQPRTLDELRTAQDKLGRIYNKTQPGSTVDETAALGGMRSPEQQSAADFVRDARRTADRLEMGPTERAVATGTAALSKDSMGKEPTNPLEWVISQLKGKNAVSKYGDDTFQVVRDDLKKWGISEKEGNIDISRNWTDTDVVDNAYYSSQTDAMAFGIYDKKVPFAMSDDVIGHEFTHRIVEKQAKGIKYEGQSGAVNESLADTMGAAIDKEDWLVGEDVVPGGVRDMRTPTTMSGYVDMVGDNGGVHINSAIPNHAAYLIGDKLGKDAMARIYAKTITNHIDKNVDFEKLAHGTWQSATELYGAKSREVEAVEDAWNGVLELDGNDRLWKDKPTYEAHAKSPTSFPKNRASPVPVPVPVPAPAPAAPHRAPDAQ